MTLSSASQENNRKRWESHSEGFVGRYDSIYVSNCLGAFLLWFVLTLLVNNEVHKNCQTAGEYSSIILGGHHLVSICLVAYCVYSTTKLCAIARWSNVAFVSDVAHKIQNAKTFGQIVEAYKNLKKTEYSDANVGILFDCGLLGFFNDQNEFVDIVTKILYIDQQLDIIRDNLDDDDQQLEDLEEKSRRLVDTYNDVYYPIVMKFLYIPNDQQ